MKPILSGSDEQTAKWRIGYEVNRRRCENCASILLRLSEPQALCDAFPDHAFPVDRMGVCAYWDKMEEWELQE